MGFEIIPNWHPLFVHYTVALISVACVLYVLAAFTGSFQGWRREAFIVARWCFIIGAISIVLTIIAGLYAYNTVAHDGPSHIAMLEHRNFAFATGGLVILLIAGTLYFKLNTPSKALGVVALMLLCSLFVTAYKGGELVFRHGLGVMSLPDTTSDHHGGSDDNLKDKSSGHHDDGRHESHDSHAHEH